eukprot:3321005-Rhodomonas_salina.3
MRLVLGSARNYLHSQHSKPVASTSKSQTALPPSHSSGNHRLGQDRAVPVQSELRELQKQSAFGLAVHGPELTDLLKVDLGDSILVPLLPFPPARRTQRFQRFDANPDLIIGTQKILAVMVSRRMIVMAAE